MGGDEHEDDGEVLIMQVRGHSVQQHRGPDNITTLLSVTVKINRTIDADNTNCRIKVLVAIMRTDYMSRNVEMLFIKKALDRKYF